MRRVVFAIMIMLTAGVAGAQRLSIGQVDTGRLLFGQRVDLYLSIDAPGELDSDALRVYESADGDVFTEVDAIIDLRQVRSLDAPLSFYVLVDNSGSMYDETVPGDPDLRRIDAARQAIRDFANSVTNERDRIGLGVFNTGYRSLSPPSRDKSGIGTLLDGIPRPAREEGYTELYAALVRSAVDASASGRRTVVVLSDGENYPYSVYENEPHPEYGDRLYTHEDAIDAFQREGLSVFAIDYGGEGDPNLQAIADATGGRVYRASGPDELAAVYRDIRSVLLEEYRLSYRATTMPAERRIVRVQYRGDDLTLRAERPYFANALFATGGDVPTLALVIVFVVGLAGMGTLLVLSFRAARAGTSLVVLDPGDARGLEKTIALGSNETVIGASLEADVTIAGAPSVADRHAVVSYEPGRSEYTIVSDSPVRVNNHPTKKRVLKPGDVINIEGTIFAFDVPDAEPDDADGASE